MDNVDRSTEDLRKLHDRVTELHKGYQKLASEEKKEAVIHPSHYNQYSNFEVIDICEQLVGPDGKGGFNLGNAFKYIARAGFKNPETHVEDLEKAVFYIMREIARVRGLSVDAEEQKEKRSFKNAGSKCAECGAAYEYAADDGTRFPCKNGCTGTVVSSTMSITLVDDICPDCGIRLTQTGKGRDNRFDFFCPNGHGTAHRNKFQTTYSWKPAS